MKDETTRIVERALKRSKTITDPKCLPRAAKHVTETVKRDYELEPRKLGGHGTPRDDQ